MFRPVESQHHFDVSDHSPSRNTYQTYVRIKVERIEGRCWSVFGDVARVGLNDVPSTA